MAHPVQIHFKRRRIGAELVVQRGNRARIRKRAEDRARNIARQAVFYDAGFVAADEPVQLVTFRVEATGIVRKAEFRPQPDAGPDASAAVMGYRDVWLAEAAGFVSCPVYDRDKLLAGNRIAGPAIVEQMDATTLVLPGMAARVEPYLNLILEAVA